MMVQDRRGFLQGSLGASITLAARSVWAQLPPGALAGSPVQDLLTVVADLVIPTTDTKGATAAGVPQFCRFAISHGLLGAAHDWEQQLAGELAAAAGRSFLQCPRSVQADVLQAHDRAALASADNRSIWPGVKTLILTGYYTSEIGASEELRYELVPGRYAPDIPNPPGTRAYSSDWDGADLK